LRRRDGLEPVSYPSPALEAVLGRTLVVPLFQEQAMKITIMAAGFSAGEADLLRRAMATFRHSGKTGLFREKLVNGMLERNYERDFAERCFQQIEGFGEYGFPESHAASFALLVYVSSWIKHYYPGVFAAALLNAQPMGFYAPAQIVRDARAPGRSPAARRQCQHMGQRARATRAVVRPATGLPPGQRLPRREARRIVYARAAPYRNVADMWRRAGLAKRHIETLARADALPRSACHGGTCCGQHEASLMRRSRCSTSGQAMNAARPAVQLCSPYPVGEHRPFDADTVDV
jgi:error-prone DNA polymerase